MPSQSKAVINPVTPREIVLWGEQQFNNSDLFFGHGTDNALDEAVMLVFHALDLPFNVSDEVLDTVCDETGKQHAIELIQDRIRTRKPGAYLINKAWFAGMEFYVNENVLVPRSPIAELINEQFAPWIDEADVKNILDLCTGSGCIALACADRFPAAHVVGTDISAQALEVAAINRDKHEMSGRVEFLKSDVLDQVPHKKYDIIVSNPPYVDAEDMANLPEEFHHEPALGLEAGHDGLDIVHRILAQAGQFLSDKGILIVEVGNSQEALNSAYPQMPFMWLEFAYGGDGVFLLTAEQLKQFTK